MELDVYLEAESGPVGRLKGGPGQDITFQYRPDYQGMALSLRMPVPDDPETIYPDVVCRAFFNNLLQEGSRLSKIAARYKIDRSDVVGLLSHLGLECAGALSIVPAGQPPGKAPGIIPDHYEPITPRQLAQDLAALTKGEPPRKPIRFSLAGVQNKMAVVACPDSDGELQLLQPLEDSGAPTTHILKVGAAQDQALVENEFICMRTARNLGLPTAEVLLRRSGDIPYLLVERYDRELVENPGRYRVHRIHQEDGCQAMGFDVGLKYEKDGDPEDPMARASFQKLYADVGMNTGDPLGFRDLCLKATFYNFLIGNVDAHAKNFSLLHQSRKPVIAPLYDLVCIALYPDYDNRLAMSIGGAETIEAVDREAWDRFFGTLGLAPTAGTKRYIEQQLKPIADEILTVMAEVIENKELSLSKARTIRDHVGERIDQLNDAFGWDIPSDTDAFSPQGGGWL